MAVPPPPSGGPPPPALKLGGGDPNKGRGALLGSIESFKKGGLKKAVTNDRSAPVVKSESGGGRGGGGARGGGGGLFAGGFPQLRGGGARGGGSPAPQQRVGGPVPPSRSARPGGGARTGMGLPPVGRVAPPSRGPPRPMSNGSPAPRPSPTRAMGIPPPSRVGGGVGRPGGGGGRASNGIGKCRAKYPFAAQQDGDLAFQPGDVITILSKDQGDWWEGELNGQTGTFPSNYTEEVFDEDISSDAGSGGGGGGGGGEQCIAIYNFPGQAAGDLPFRKGDVITIIEKEGQWWKGELNGQVGMFPYNYVKEHSGGGGISPAPSRAPSPMRPSPGPPRMAIPATRSAPPSRAPPPTLGRSPGRSPPATLTRGPPPPTGGPPPSMGAPPSPSFGAPPPPAGGPPPPSPGGPPPPAGGPPKLGGGAPDKNRGALLSSIEGFKKGGLKKTQTNDRSSPVLGKGDSGGGGGASRGGGGPGGLFAGGFPQLRGRGGGGSSAPSRAAPVRAASRGPPPMRAAPPPARLPPPRAEPQVTAIALYSYAAAQAGDLDFAQGDVIVVTKQSGNWWEGTVAGRTGVFPSNYVQLQ